MSRLTRRSDTADVVATLHRRYAVAADLGDATGMTACFSPAGVLVTSSGAIVVGHAELLAFGATWSAGKPMTRHECSLHESTAAAGWIRSSCQARVTEISAEGPPRVLLAAKYHDLVVFDGREWLLAFRVVSPDRSYRRRT